MKKIESKAIELLGKDTFDSYLELIKKIIENDKFDYIILIDRKGAAIFRAFLRVLKEEEGITKTKKSIILSSCVVGSYSFDVKENIKVLIFDDIINRGRNLCRIIKDLYRRGLRNISYTALAYRKDLKKGGDSVSICKNGKEMEIKITDGIFKGGEFSVGIEVFGITELSPFKEGEKGPKVCLEESETKDLAETLNKFVHYSMTPYTAYIAYGRFEKGEFPKFPNLEFKVPDNYVQLPYDVQICKDVGVEAALYCENEEYSLTTGYFSGIRVFTNKYIDDKDNNAEDETEYLIRPCFFLPPLKKKHIEMLFETLKLDKKFPEKKTKRNFTEGKTVEQGENKKDLELLATKTQLEIKIRLVTSVLTAIKGIDFAIKALDGISEMDIVKVFAKSFARYFFAEEYGDKDKQKECLNETIDLFIEAKTAIDNNRGLFNFRSNYQSYDVEQCRDYYLLNCTDYKDELDKKNENIKEIISLKKGEENGYVTYSFVERILENTKDDFPRFFSELSIFLDNVDEKIEAYKLFPIPLAETIRLIHKERDYPEYLFPEIIAAFDACIEDGSMGDCVYVERMKDDDSFMALHYYQHGESAPLEYFKMFIVSWKYLINNINGSLELCADGMTDSEIKTMMNDYKNIVSKHSEGFLNDLLLSTFIVFNRGVADVKALLNKKNFYSIVEEANKKIDDIKKMIKGQKNSDEPNIVKTLSRVAGIWRSKLIKQRIDKKNG